MTSKSPVLLEGEGREKRGEMAVVESSYAILCEKLILARCRLREFHWYRGRGSRGKGCGGKRVGFSVPIHMRGGITGGLDLPWPGLGLMELKGESCYRVMIWIGVSNISIGCEWVCSVTYRSIGVDEVRVSPRSATVQAESQDPAK